MAPLILVSLLLTSAVHVRSFPSGPPVGDSAMKEEICRTMSPQTGHGYSSVSGAAPFTISVGSSTYSAGQAITVRLEVSDGSSHMEGLFVQARRRGVGRDRDHAIGNFTDVPLGTAAVDCGRPGNAWAQSEELDATAASVKWMAPPCDEGPIAFMATIVKGPKSAFWTGILSLEIRFTGANSTECHGGMPKPTGGPPTSGDKTGPPTSGDKTGPPTSGDNTDRGGNGATGISVPSLVALFAVIVALVCYMYF